MQFHLDQCANFGSLPLKVRVTASHKVAFNIIKRQNWHKIQQMEINKQMKHPNNFCQQSAPNIQQIHARYAFPLEDLFQCFQHTKIGKFLNTLSQIKQTLQTTTYTNLPI